jgi:catechol-2,3-dioxygenase
LFNRRSFLSRAAAMLPLLHAAPLFAMRPDASPESSVDRFARLRLKTGAPMDDLARFYGDTLRLPVERKDNAMIVTAGGTLIEFAPAEGTAKPYYHFAFNIPHNKLDAAVKWMDGRAALVKRNDGDGVIFHFPNWDAHAIYFLDPAGNILEFIARHTLKNDAPGDFSETDVLCASEIGVVAPDVVSAADQLCGAVKLERYRGGDENFTAVGDEHGLFIVVKTRRKWFSSDRAAEVFEAEAVVRAEEELDSLRLVASQFKVGTQQPRQ